MKEIQTGRVTSLSKGRARNVKTNAFSGERNHVRDPSQNTVDSQHVSSQSRPVTILGAFRRVNHVTGSKKIVFKLPPEK